MSNIAENLKNHLPPLIRKDDFVDSIAKSSGAELGRINDEIQLTYKEFFLDTATGIGLEALEHRLGIVVDHLKPIEQRRSLVKARRRSRKKVSLSVIDSICEAWINGLVDTSITGSKIKVKFVSVGGVPDKLEDLQETLQKSMPSHLDIEWEFTYLTWFMYESYNQSWDEWDKLGLSWDELEVFI